MKKTVYPQDQTFWYLQRPNIPPLRTHKETEVVVIGGGIAGLSAAQAFAKKGKKVILLEAYYCGAGASGKSSGFITPNGELSFSELIQRYGPEGGKTIWDAISTQGVEHIRANIKQYHLSCDYSEQDAFEVASTEKDIKIILKEAENLARYGYETTFIKKEEVSSLLGTGRYHGGVLYTKSFGINMYKYCQGMKNVLIQEGVDIYEETPALCLEENLVTTAHATIKADFIIVCADRFIPTLGKLSKEIYHVQTFLLASQVLPPSVVQKIFPQRKLMVWDTDLVYSYFRMAEDRLLIGGGSVATSYASHETYQSEPIYKKLTGYIQDTFDLTLQYEQMWPGLIGVSKDIAPLAGPDKDIPSIYYVGAAAGLPMAALLGNYAAEYLIEGADTLKDYFSPYRKFPLNPLLQTILGTKATFALSNWISHGNT